jgi:hypothetical protein
VAALQENDLANRRPSMPSLITTIGGTIAAGCSRWQSQRNYEFAIHRVEELTKQADDLEIKIGPEYVALMEGLSQIDENSSEGKQIEPALASLEKLCR